MRSTEEVLTSMSRYVALALAATISCSVVLDARDVSIDAVSAIYASRDGKHIALVSRYQDGGVIHVVRRTPNGAAATLTLTEDTLSKFIEEANISSVEWSSTGKWLKIEVNDGDVDQAVVVVDVTKGAESLHEIRVAGRAAASASWAMSGDRLYVATTLEDEFNAAADDGIYIVDLADGKTRHLTKGIAVSARLSVAENVIVTKMQQVEGDTVRHVLVAIDISTGSVKRLLPR